MKAPSCLVIAHILAFSSLDHHHHHHHTSPPPSVLPVDTQGASAHARKATYQFQSQKPHSGSDQLHPTHRPRSPEQPKDSQDNIEQRREPPIHVEDLEAEKRDLDRDDGVDAQAAEVGERRVGVVEVVRGSDDVGFCEDMVDEGDFGLTVIEVVDGHVSGHSVFFFFVPGGTFFRGFTFAVLFTHLLYSFSFITFHRC